MFVFLLRRGKRPFCDFQKKYVDFLGKNEIFADEFQEGVVRRLQRKLTEYEKYYKIWCEGRLKVRYSLQSPKLRKPVSEYDEFAIQRKTAPEQSNYHLVSSPFVPQRVQGFYLWGKSGCGKTFLSELFFDNIAVPKENKKALHYNEFMLDVHKRSFVFHQQKLQDPLYQFAFEFSIKTCMLYLDEFQVTDIADALVLKRLFTLLWSFGVLLFTSSNRAPETLYHNGLQRENFLPFIPALRAHCEVIKLEFRKDYREAQVLAELERREDDRPGSYLLAAEGAEQQMRVLFLRYSGGRPSQSTEVEVLPGRKIALQGSKGVLWAQFPELLLAELGPDDFIAVARTFSVVFLLGAPQLRSAEGNVFRRFVWLVDQLYLHRVKLFLSAESPLAELLVHDPLGCSDADLEARRCLSRLSEMQTLRYFRLPHRGP